MELRLVEHPVKGARRFVVLGGRNGDGALHFLLHKGFDVWAFHLKI